MDELTQDVVRTALDYSPESGVLRWRRPPSRNATIKAGDLAGCINSDGYLQVKLRGKSRIAHRLIWLYQHGVWPSGVIDHRNGVKTDNRLVNLREVSVAVNSQNRKKVRSCRKYDLPMCVYTNEHNLKTLRRPYQAKVFIQGKYVSGGFYSTPEAASEKAEAMRLAHTGYVNE